MNNASPESVPAETPLGVRFTLRGLLVMTAVLAVLLAPAGWLGWLYTTSLTISLLVLLGVTVALWRRSTGWAVMACIGGLLIFAFGVSGMVAMLALSLHCLLTLVVVLVTLPLKERAIYRVGGCVVVMLVCYLGWAYDAAGKHRQLQELLARYPIVSVEERLQPVVNRTLPIDTQRLSDLDSRFDRWSYSWSGRARMLDLLHTEYAQQFAVSSGFGVARMPNLLHQPESHFVAQPALQRMLPTVYRLSEGRLDAVDFSDLHGESLVAFASTERSGMVRSAAETAGFQSHAFTQLPGQETEAPSRLGVRVELRRLELVGYAYHEAPVVYVSEKLPNMETIAETPTRALDAFEQAAFPKLVKGEDLIVQHAEAADGQHGATATRMLGAVRAATSCTACHQVAPGSLLGAFSYDLTLLSQAEPSFSIAGAVAE